MTAREVERRAQVAQHPIRVEVLADLESSPIRLTATDLAIATGQPVSIVGYHLAVLSDAGWLVVDPVVERVSVPDARRDELRAALRAAIR